MEDIRCTILEHSWMANSKVVVSSCLIRMKPRISLSKEDKKRFCLGLPDWCPCCDCSMVDLVGSSVDELVMKLDVNKPLRLKHSKSRCIELPKGDSLEPGNKELKVDADQGFMFDVTCDDLRR